MARFGFGSVRFGLVASARALALTSVVSVMRLSTNFRTWWA